MCDVKFRVFSLLVNGFSELVQSFRATTLSTSWSDQLNDMFSMKQINL